MGQYRRKLKKRGWRWYYRGQYLGQKYHSKAIYLTKKEAKDAEREHIGKIDSFMRNPKLPMLLFDLMEKRLDYIKLNHSKFYYTENKRYFKKGLALWGYNLHVHEIKRKDMEDLLMAEAKRLKQAQRTNHKLNAMIRCYKALFNYGISTHDVDAVNPCFGIKFYPIDTKLKYIPDESEITQVKEISTLDQRLLIDFVYQTGCRIMEAIRLKPEDIEKDTIVLWTRKSKNSNLTPRRVPKPDCIKGLDFKGFPQWQGYPRFLEAKIVKLELKVKWNWHNLRHARASIWANDGMTTIEIMARLGHNNIETTMRYLQLLGFSRW